MILPDYKAKTPREQKLQSIFEGIGHLQHELLLSRELSQEPVPKDINAVYCALEEAKQLLRRVK